MFSKSAIVFAFMAVAKLAVATPPACILGAMSSQPDPTDFATICSGKVATGVQSYLSSNCGSSSSDAQKYFADTCKSAGHAVSAVSASSSAASSAASSAGSSVVTYTSKFIGSDGITHTTVGTATAAASGGVITATAGSNGTVVITGTPTVTPTPSSTGLAQSNNAAGLQAHGTLVGCVLALAGVLAVM